jgi:hypothetical protein
VLRDAKRVDVIKGLTWLETESEEGDINLLFLAGHGTTKNGAPSCCRVIASGTPRSLEALVGL